MLFMVIVLIKTTKTITRKNDGFFIHENKSQRKPPSALAEGGLAFRIES